MLYNSSYDVTNDAIPDHIGIGKCHSLVRLDDQIMDPEIAVESEMRDAPKVVHIV